MLAAQRTMIRLGIDFDNTIVDYSEIFYEIAIEKGYIHEQIGRDKNSVRDFMNSNHLKEEFTEMQGEVYGKELKRAKPCNKVIETILNLSEIGNLDIHIISHKTKFPIAGPKHDLHEAAMNWLIINGLTLREGAPIKKDNIHFCETKENKIDRIKETKCDIFIDDLESILDAISDKVKKVHFSPKTTATIGSYQVMREWDAVLLRKIIEAD